jgi:type II secretory pathway component GspD/PulD (secretin)
LPGAARPAGLPGAAGAVGGPPAVGGVGVGTKFTTLRFRTKSKDLVESGYLEDIRLSSDARLNAVVISAPEKAMSLLDALIDELDVPPEAFSNINIFTLKNADASAMAATLQQLFLGTTSTTTAAPTTAPGGVPGLPGGVPGLPGGPGAFPSTTAAIGGTGRPLVVSITGQPPDYSPVIDLRLTVDTRTNSLIVAGSENDLRVVDTIITRLDDAVVLPRRNEVYTLVNATAVDVANALNNFIVSALNVYSRGGQLTPFQDVEREVIVVPEPITNKLLISATPRYYPDVMRMIAELDAELPQVVIQVLVAEVDLNNDDEFGVEIGLQSPVFFQRSIFPFYQDFGAGSTSLTANTSTASQFPAINTVPTGVSITTVPQPSSITGFAFNQPNQGFPNNVVVAPKVVGYQGLTNFGTGRISPNNGISGFVFSASNDVFNLLIRALRSQGRVDMLSRPQLMTLDNQAAQIAIGQSVPTIQGSNITGTGIVSTPVTYVSVGVILNVIPKINPDGKVTMRVTPQVSSLASTPLSLGNGITAPLFNQQLLDTTVIAHDGETVAIGGLITTSDSKSENKMPWFGDLPYIGTLFRYRQQIKKKQELLIILTPHIVRNRIEADRILAMEGARMDWILGDVVRTQGISGMDPLFPGKPLTAASSPPHGNVDGALPGPLAPPPPGMVPGSDLPPAMLPAPRLVPAPGSDNTLPAPRPVPSGSSSLPAAPGGPTAATTTSNNNANEPPTLGPTPERPLQGLSAVPGRLPPPPASPMVTSPPPAGDSPQTAPGGGTTGTITPLPAEGPGGSAENQGKESDKWRLFRLFK